MRKFVVLLLLTGAVLAVAAKYIFMAPARKEGRGSVVAVETAVIRTATLSDKVIFTGTVMAEERYDAAPKIAGILRTINYNVGDKIEKGAVLAVLDDDEHKLLVDQQRAALSVAQANANDAKAQLEIVRRDYERVDALRRGRVISVQEFDKADAALKAQEARYETALANVRLNEAILKSAEVRLGYTRVTADWDEGPDVRVIGQRFRDTGALVAANTPILSILDIGKVRAVISVSEKQYPKIALGGRVAVTTDAFPGRIYEGRVSRIPQELGELTRDAEIEVAIPNDDLTLKPGMFVRADIEFQRRDNAVAAPVAAVVRRDDGTRGVYLVDEDQDNVAFAPVTEGIIDGNLVELIGAEPLLGREVVVLGQHLLKDGITVKVANTAAAAVRGGTAGKTAGGA